MAEEEKQEAEQKPVTREDIIATIRKAQENDMARNDRAERLRILKRKSENGQPWNNPLFGAYNPSIEYTDDELRSLVPLERDRLNYDWVKTDVNGDVITHGVVATNKYGLYCVPKTPGRKHPHMNKKRQAIKSESLRIFKELFEKQAAQLKTTCTAEGIEYLGIPDAMLTELGAKATRIAGRVVKAKNRLRSRNHRRRQEHSRRVNAGLPTTSEKRFVNRGGQYGV